MRQSKGFKTSSERELIFSSTREGERRERTAGRVGRRCSQESENCRVVKDTARFRELVTLQRTNTFRDFYLRHGEKIKHTNIDLKN